MFFIPASAAILASVGWAVGIVLAQGPARTLGAFEFTRVQLIACAAIMAAICSLLGYWPTIIASHWAAYGVSIGFGIILGNLAMIECLRRGGPRRTELLLSLKAPIIALMAYFWLGETLSPPHLIGGGVVLCGIVIATQFGDTRRWRTDETIGHPAWIPILGILATTFQGLGFLIMKPAMQMGTEPIAISAVRLLGAAFLITVIALWPAKIFRAPVEPTPGLISRTILPGFIGYGVSSSILLYAFANFDAGLAALLGSLSPVLVLPILWIKERRPPSKHALAGGVLSVIGTSIIILG